MPPAKPKQKPGCVKPLAKPVGKRDVKGELDHAREERLPRVSDMYVRGRTQSDIAAEFGITRQMISKDLEVIRARWREAQVRDFDAAIAEQLAKIDTVEFEYWSAWERSKNSKTFKTTARRGGVDSASVSQEDQFGDPRYLQGVERCIERRCKLLGLDAPEKRELSGPGGGPIVSEARGPLLTPEEAVKRYGDVFRRVIEDADGDAAGGDPAREQMDSARADGAAG